MRKILGAISLLIISTINAGTQQWTSIHPAGTDSAIGGPVLRLSYSDSDEAYMLSELGRIYHRSTIDQPWVPIPVSLNGNAILLTRFHVGAGDPAVLLGGVGADRLVRSTNGGMSWTELNLPTTGTGVAGRIYGLVSASGDADVIYYAVQFKIFFSNNGGLTWSEQTQSGPRFAWDLEVHPLSSSTLHTMDEQVFRSSFDSGQNWSFLINGIDPNHNTTQFGLDPTNLQTLYASAAHRIYKSVDAAANWALIASIPFGQGINDIAVDTSNPSIVYAVTSSGGATGSIYRSVNNGSLWLEQSNSNEWGALSHAAVSSAGEVMVGGTSGVLTSANGESFVPGNAGFNDFYVAFMAVAPTNENIIYAAGLWGGVIVSIDAGETWTVRNNGIAPSNGRHISVDPNNAMRAFYSANAGLYTTVDGGKNWVEINFTSVSLQPVRSLTITPGNPNRLYARNNGLSVSEDGGQTWADILDGSTFITGGPNYPIVVPANEPMTVYVGTFQQGLRRSTDAGQTWESLNSGLPNLFVNSIALDSTNPQRIVLGLDDNVIVESLDGGASWLNISSNLPSGIIHVASTVIDHFNGDIYALLNSPEGVHRRKADSAEWQLVSGGDYDSSIDSGQVLASTHTRGRIILQTEEMFIYDFDDDSDGVADGADNCVYLSNANQRDTDGDQIGNACDADIAPAANDCVVNFLDLYVLSQNFLVGGNLDTDFNGDGQTDFFDVAILKEQFLQSPGPSALATCF